MADPYCHVLRGAVLAQARASGATAHDGGAYVVIEGPAFGTRAESHLYRAWGASVVGMTALPEAKLAREAELCYATLAAVTDYDCWHETAADVTAEAVFAVLRHNVEISQEIVRRMAATAETWGSERCGCGQALDAALVTAPDAVPPEAAERLAPLLARRLGKAP
jgi:5'-methylthioadenosine phosphorylase